MADAAVGTAPDVGELAAQAKAAAKAHGAVGPGQHGKLTAGQRAFRDGAIMAGIHAGEKPSELAKEFGISLRQLRNVTKRFREGDTVLDEAPMEIVNRMIRTYELAMRRFAALADENRDRMPAVALGAVKAEVDAFEKLLGVLVATDKLPHNLELFRSEDEMNRIGVLMVEKVMAFERGEITASGVADFFFGMVAPDVQKVRELGPAPADADVVGDG